MKRMTINIFLLVFLFASCYSSKHFLRKTINEATTLNLTYQNITDSIPKELLKGNRLSKIVLTGNARINIEKILKQIDAENFELESFFCDGCNIEVLPKSKTISNLDTLSLASNHITNFNEYSDIFQNLKYLSVDNNNGFDVNCIDDSFPYIECLGLRNVNLTSFPTKLCSLNHLKRLYLDENEINEIPCEINNCLALEMVTLAYNPIEEVPSCFPSSVELLGEWFFGKKILPSRVIRIPKKNN